jgi:hypothetical protein
VSYHEQATVDQQSWNPTVPIPGDEMPTTLFEAWDDFHWFSLYADWAYQTQNWTLPSGLQALEQRAAQGFEPDEATALLNALGSMLPLLDPELIITAHASTKDFEAMDDLISNAVAALARHDDEWNLFRDAVTDLMIWADSDLGSESDADETIQVSEGGVGAQPGVVDYGRRMANERPADFVGWFGERSDGERDELLKVPEVFELLFAQAVRDSEDDAIAYALWYLGTYGIAPFGRWFDELPEHQQEVLLLDSAIEDWAGLREPVEPAPMLNERRRAEVAERNSAYVAGIGHEDTGTWQAANDVVLLGDGHGSSWGVWLQSHAEYAKGEFEVVRTPLNQLGVPDQILFYDVPPMLRDSFTFAVSEFSDLVVQFGESGDRWKPTRNDLETLADSNGVYVKNLDNREEGIWQVGGSLVVLGGNSTYDQWIQAQPDYAYGKFRVERARIGAGKLRFTSVPSRHEDAIETAVSHFSDKKVVFA